jgi:hypothetical protein
MSSLWQAVVVMVNVTFTWDEMLHWRTSLKSHAMSPLSRDASSRMVAYHKHHCSKLSHFFNLAFVNPLPDCRKKL